MNPIVAEWIAKSDGDHAVARLVLAAESPNFDAVCSHAQQAAEKLMKAVLIARGAPTTNAQPHGTRRVVATG